MPVRAAGCAFIRSDARIRTAGYFTNVRTSKMQRWDWNRPPAPGLPHRQKDGLNAESKRKYADSSENVGSATNARTALI